MGARDDSPLGFRFACIMITLAGILSQAEISTTGLLTVPVGTATRPQTVRVRAADDLSRSSGLPENRSRDATIILSVPDYLTAVVDS